MEGEISEMFALADKIAGVIDGHPALVALAAVGMAVSAIIDQIPPADRTPLIDRFEQTIRRCAAEQQPETEH